MTSAAPRLDATIAQISSKIDRTVRRSFLTFATRCSLPEVGLFTSTLLSSAESGKRFRALSSVLGAATWLARTDDAAPEEILLRAATESNLALGAALEFYQAAALVHDDIVDRAEERRGKPATHRAFAATEGSDHFGVSAGILGGDFLLSAAEMALDQAASPTRQPELRQRFHQMTGEVAYGQFLDLQASFAPLGELELIRQVIRLKSARYSVAHPVALGALQAGADPEWAHTLEQVFEPAGVAFQLRDDHLGVLGEPTQTGKPAGGDIVERKRTVLLALTVQHAPSAQRRQLEEIYRQEPGPEQVAQARDLIETYGVGPHEEYLARELDLAHHRLAEAKLPGPAQELCLAFIRLLVERDR